VAGPQKLIYFIRPRLERERAETVEWPKWEKKKYTVAECRLQFVTGRYIDPVSGHTEIPTAVDFATTNSLEEFYHRQVRKESSRPKGLFNQKRARSEVDVSGLPQLVLGLDEKPIAKTG